MKASFRVLAALALALAAAACAHVDQDVDVSDAGIKARVEAAMRGRRDLDVRYVSLDVDNGVVTVSGIVTSPDQREVIDRLIKRTAGVETVVDNLIVQE